MFELIGLHVLLARRAARPLGTFEMVLDTRSDALY